MSFAFGLRAKVTLLASFFLVLPWIGYQYIVEMEHFLRQSQQQSLIDTTRALASALHDRPTLFNRQASALNKIEAGKDLYAYRLTSPISIDGRLNDWQSEQDKRLLYAEQQRVYQRSPHDENPISFQHMLGTRGDYLYAYFEVTDKHPTLRHVDDPVMGKSDHLIIALSTPTQQLQRYIISVHKKGWFNAYQLPTQSQNGQRSDTNLRREKRIQGYWRGTAQGYNIELRLPTSMIGDKLGFALHNSDNHQAIASITATSETHSLAQLGTLLVPSPSIQKILSSARHNQSRLWVVDPHQRVLARVGNIHQADGVWAESDDNPVPPSHWQQLQKQWLDPLYRSLFLPTHDDFVDDLATSTQLNSPYIARALGGESQSNWRYSDDNQALIVSAASPIFIADEVVGMVVVEQTTNAIRTLRNQALSKLFNVLLVVILVATLMLFLFTANIAKRITRLRDQAEQVTDQHGRINHRLTPSAARDEIGDLSRSLAAMVARLSQYHHYLEKLPARLSHELGTPVAVVRSSLENLALHQQDTQSQKYTERAQTGILRLNRILTNMSEATRLEQSLQSGEKIALSLSELLNGCVQGYQMTYTEQRFVLTEDTSSAMIVQVDPDFMVQCLDKLINNAREFSPPETSIELVLKQVDQAALIIIKNRGPLLPQDMGEELLNSMVSVRSHTYSQQTHLGLGLFIAKMICDYHQGQIAINNNHEKNGVDVTLRLPLKR